MLQRARSQPSRIHSPSMSRRWVASVLAAVVGGASNARAQATAVPEALSQRVRASCEQLQAFGVKLSAESVPIEVRHAAAFEAGIARERDLVLGARYAELQYHLRQALGADVGRSADELRAQLAKRAAEGVACRYDFEQGKLAVAANALDAANDEHLLLHELARAWRDQQTDLTAWFEVEPRTTEAARIRQSWFEGESGLAALRVRQKNAGRELDQLSPESIAGLDLLATREEPLRMARSGGRDAWLRSMRQRESEELVNVWASPPTSTEQILHGLKFGSDTPRAVELPAWPESAAVAEIVHQDTLGELELCSLLIDCGLDAPAAQIAALGWDGDRIQLVRAKTGELALALRIVFDRSEDARQFAAAWTSRTSGHMNARGPMFDWVRSDSVRFGNALGAALKADELQREPSAGDRESTEALERLVHPVDEGAPRVVDERWLHPRYGVSIPVPPGWLATTINGKHYLMGEQQLSSRDLLGVVALDNLAGKNLATLLEEHRAAIAGAEGSHLLAAESRKVGGKDVLWLCYDVSIEGSQPLHLINVVFLNGSKQVIVTANITDRTWPRVREPIEAALGGMTFDVAARREGR